MDCMKVVKQATEEYRKELDKLDFDEIADM